MVGFEAMISSQIITVQIKDKTKIEDCYFDTATNGNLQHGNGGILCFACKTALRCFDLIQNFHCITAVQVLVEFKNCVQNI